MKKTIMSSLLMFVAVTLFAATPTTWTNVVTLKLTDGNNDTYTSRFGEATELTDAPSWGAGVANLEGATVRAYTVLNGEKYEKLFLNDMTNTLLEVKTYNSTSLTFKMTANYGVITLYDMQEDRTLTVDKAGVEGLTEDTYTCTVPVNTTVKNRFYIFYNGATFYPVTTNAYGYASFSYTEDLELATAGAKLYTGAISGETLNMTEVDYVKAGEGVIVYGAPSTTYYFAVGNGAADFTGNDLKATSTYNTSMKNVFVLKGNAFLEYVGTNALAANKAYIQLPAAGPNNAPKRITMRFNGTTAVDNVEAESVKAEKFVENGEIFIRRGNEVYNLQGQLVK
ncbi:MAG: hypothetical protein J5937_04525 [Paludibacteraceae bacterium]|nr:hypothetical protein [Paludibacteraceae bacterium]